MRRERSEKREGREESMKTEVVEKELWKGIERHKWRYRQKDRQRQRH